MLMSASVLSEENPLISACPQGVSEINSHMFAKHAFPVSHWVYNYLNYLLYFVTHDQQWFQPRAAVAEVWKLAGDARAGALLY